MTVYPGEGSGRSNHPDCCEWRKGNQALLSNSQDKRQWAQLKKWKLYMDTIKCFFYCKSGQIPDQAVQRSCGVFIIGDFQNPSWSWTKCSSWPGFSRRTWAGRSQQALSKLSNSVLITWSNSAIFAIRVAVWSILNFLKSFGKGEWTALLLLQERQVVPQQSLSSNVSTP